MSSIKLILLGWLRHTIGLLGFWLVQHGYLAADAQSSFVAKAVEEAMGGVLLLVAYGWSGFDKTLVIEWIRKALHMPVPKNAGAGAEKATAERISPLITSPGTTPTPVVGLLLAALLVVPLSSCSSWGLWQAWSGNGTTATARTPLEIAKLTYADASLAHEFTMETVTAAKDAGKLPLPLWQRAYDAQEQIKKYAPKVRSAINLWESSGVKPATIDEALSKLSAASAEIRAVKVGLTP